MKINSFDPLFEYPEYNQTGTSAKATAAAKSVTAPGKKPSQAPSASPTTTGNKISEPEPKEPTIAKASELKKDFEFPDEKGNVLKVISPVGQRTDLPNDMEDVVIAQDAKKNVVVFDKDADIALPQVEVEESKLDDIIDPKKKSFAKKLMRKQNKLKHLIRAAKFDAQDAAGGVLYEINFNNANVIKAALDAPIQCGFEAETVWTEVGGSGTAIDFNYTDWDEIKDAILDQEGSGAVDDIQEAFNSWAIESDQFYEIESDLIANEVKDREEDEYYINAYADAELFRDDVEDYKEEVMSNLRSRATQGDMFSDNDEEGDPDADEEYAERQDWDYDAWAREFIEEQHMDDLREWLADQIRDNGEIWDQAWEEFYNKYDIESWVGIEYSGDWLQMLSDHSVYGLAGSDDESDLDEVATALEDWASNNSYSNDVRPGSYHSGSGTDNKYWRVEDDSSIEGSGAKAEIISPVYQTPREMLSEMNSLFKFMQANNVETNSSTGFHVTMSMGTGEDQSPNQLKLAVLLNDNYLLKQFNRVGNTYARSQLDRVKHQLLRAIDGDDQSLAALEQSLGGALSQDKFNSINFKGIDNELGNQMVEFRIAGGSNYVVKFQDLSKAAIKYAVTLQAAHDPDAFRQDYLKALYKMINQVHSGTLKTSRKDGNVDIPDTPGAEGLKNLVIEIPSAEERLENFERIASMYQNQRTPETFLYNSNYIIGKVIRPFIDQGREPESLKFSLSLARGLRAALKDFGMTPQSYMDWAMGPRGMTWMTDDELSDRWTLAVVRGILAMPKLTPAGYTEPEQKEESMDFDSLSLEEQLQFVSKLDKAKIDEAWSQKYKDSINCSDPKGFSQKAHCAGKKKKKRSVEEADQVKAKERKPKIVKPNKGHQSKHPYRGRLVGEGAVPETEISDEFAQLMNKPLLGSDIRSQMYAYQIVPDPAMIKEFRNMIASGGKDVDLRPIFKSFASAKLHPAQKKKVGLSESVLAEAPQEILNDFVAAQLTYNKLKNAISRACKIPAKANKCNELSAEMQSIEMKISSLEKEILSYTAKAKDVKQARKAGEQETLAVIRDYKNKVDLYLNRLSDKISGGFDYIVMTDDGIEELEQNTVATQKKQKSELASVTQIKQALISYFEDPELFNDNPDFTRAEVLSFLEAASAGKILSMDDIMKVGTDPELPDNMIMPEIVAMAAEKAGNNKFIKFYDKLVDDGIMYQTVANTTSGNVGPGELALLLLAAPAEKGARGDLNVNGKEVEIKSGSYGKGATNAGGKFNSDFIVKGNLAGGNLRKSLNDYFNKTLGKDFDSLFKRWMSNREKPNEISSKATRYKLIPRRMNLPSISNGAIAEIYNPFFRDMGFNRDQMRSLARLISIATFSDEARNKKGGHLSDVFNHLSDEFGQKGWYSKQISNAATSQGIDGEKLKQIILALQFASYQLNKGHDQILYINKTNQKLTNVISAKDLIDKYNKGLIVTAKDINLTDTQQTAAHSVTAGL